MYNCLGLSISASLFLYSIIKNSPREIKYAEWLIEDWEKQENDNDQFAKI